MLALGAAGLPLATFVARDWLLLAATSLLIYMAGMAANDLADRKKDAVSDPARPLPSGALSPRAVLLAVLVFVAGALFLGGGPQGNVYAVVAAILCAGLYDFGPRGSLLFAALSMGGVRCANAAIAVLPLVLTGQAPWLVLLGPVCLGLYSAGVTILSTTEDRAVPQDLRERRVWIARALSATAFICAATLVWIVGGLPTLGIMIAFGVASSSLFGRTPRTTMMRDGVKLPRPAKAQVLEMLLGIYWLAAVLAGGGHDGSLGGALTVSFSALVAAWVLAIGSQLMIRALRK